MGILSFVRLAVWSFRKSGRLKRLQALAAPRESPQKILEDFRAGKAPSDIARMAAISEYFDMCEEDPGVRAVMRQFQLDRADLANFVTILSDYGLFWVKGHYAPLSSIAYPEPLYFLCEMTARDEPIEKTVMLLLMYWRGEIPQRGLLALLSK